MRVPLTPLLCLFWLVQLSSKGVPQVPRQPRRLCPVKARVSRGPLKEMVVPLLEDGAELRDENGMFSHAG